MPAGKVILFLTLLAVALAVWSYSTGRYHCMLPGHKHRLYCAVNTHTGFAHMTRGMNTGTIAALDAAATADDIPLLQTMLFSPDRIAMMTAAKVLQRKGQKGRNALMEAFHKAKESNDLSLADDINEYGDLGQKVY